MNRHIGIVILALLVVLFLVVYTVAFQVSQLTDLVVLTTFGATQNVYDGRDPNAAGLHLKWVYPIQEAVHYDGRTMLFENPLEQVETRDKQNVIVEFFCAWRIADPARLLQNVKTVQAAEERIQNIVRAEKQVISRYDLRDLINTDPSQMKLEEVEAAVTRAVSAKVREDYGAEIVMIGIKRLGLPPQVTEKVIDSMKAERQMVAQSYQTRGKATAMAIRERARAASDKILAFARRKEQDIRSQGDAAGAEYYAKFKGHEDFVIFLEALDSLEKELGERTVILLDESALPFIEWFRKPPTPETLRSAITTQPAASPDGRSRP